MVANQKRESGGEETFSLSEGLSLDISRHSYMRSSNLLVKPED